MQSLLLVCFKQ